MQRFGNLEIAHVAGDDVARALLDESPRSWSIRTVSTAYSGYALRAPADLRDQLRGKARGQPLEDRGERQRVERLEGDRLPPRTALAELERARA